MILYDKNKNAIARCSENLNNKNKTQYLSYATDKKTNTSLNINLEQGSYVITAVNPVTGELYSNIIDVLPAIVENSDLVKYYKNDSQFYATILDYDGNPVINKNDMLY